MKSDGWVNDVAHSCAGRGGVAGYLALNISNSTIVIVAVDVLFWLWALGRLGVRA